MLIPSGGHDEKPVVEVDEKCEEAAMKKYLMHTGGGDDELVTRTNVVP